MAYYAPRVMASQYYPPPVQVQSSSSFPTPPLVMLIIIAFGGYHILKRQEAARDRAKVLQKESAKDAKEAAAITKALTSKDVSGGFPSSSNVGNPAPKQVSGKGGDPRKDPSSTSFRKNYFLTMQGPGRPALVPFQDGLRPKKGEAEGTMWWDNIPEGGMIWRTSANPQMPKTSWQLHLIRTSSRR
jgi:hypothetical protein